MRGFSLQSIYSYIFSKPRVSTEERRRETTPWLLLPMNSSRKSHIPEKAVEKSFAYITRTVAMSTLVAPLGGIAKLILSVDLTFHKRSVIAATKLTYLRISSE